MAVRAYGLEHGDSVIEAPQQAQQFALLDPVPQLRVAILQHVQQRLHVRPLGRLRPGAHIGQGRTVEAAAVAVVQVPPQTPAQQQDPVPLDSHGARQDIHHIVETDAASIMRAPHAAIVWGEP